MNQWTVVIPTGTEIVSNRLTKSSSKMNISQFSTGTTGLQFDLLSADFSDEVD